MSYDGINYIDVVNQVQQNGWQIASQTDKATVIEKRVGVPGIIVIPLALIPLIGMMIGLAWIAAAGKAIVTIERKLNRARILTPRNEFDVNSREDLDVFFNDYNFRGHIGYYPVAMVGIVVLFIGGILIQFVQ